MGSMRELRRAAMDSIGKPLLFHGQAGFGLVLTKVFERVVRGEVGEEAIAAVMGNRAGTLAELIAGQKPSAGPQLIPTGSKGGAVALLQLRGVATHSIDYPPYAFSTMLLERDMRALAADDKVETIAMIVDSPGGQVTGTPEAGDAIYAAAKKKKVVAIVNPLCASAAYWLASQASEIIAVKSADVGSIGVYMVHTDCSKFNEQQGTKYTYIFAGKHKVEGNSDEPLSDEAKAYYQSETDSIYRDFIKAVARGRNVSVEKVEADFGQGRCMMAPVAKRQGLIDHVATLDGAMAYAGASQAVPARMRGQAEVEARALKLAALRVSKPVDAVTARRAKLDTFKGDEVAARRARLLQLLRSE